MILRMIKNFLYIFDTMHLKTQAQSNVFLVSSEIHS